VELLGFFRAYIKWTKVFDSLNIRGDQTRKGCWWDENPYHETAEKKIV